MSPRGVAHARRHSAALAERGFDDRHRAIPTPSTSAACSWCCATAKELVGVADPRRDGSAAGARGGDAAAPALACRTPDSRCRRGRGARCLLTPEEIAADGDGGAARDLRPAKRRSCGFVTTEVARAIVDLNRAEDDLPQGRRGQDPHLLGGPGLALCPSDAAEAEHLLDRLPPPLPSPARASWPRAGDPRRRLPHHGGGGPAGGDPIPVAPAPRCVSETPAGPVRARSSRASPRPSQRPLARRRRSTIRSAAATSPAATPASSPGSSWSSRGLRTGPWPRSGRRCWRRCAAG